ncbi:MAG: phage holin family protein [Oscillospiraceae bacterium]
MDFISYVKGEGIILIPVLYILGLIIKGIEKIPDKYIPVILLFIGCLLSLLLLGFTASSFIQGVLLTGAAVYGHQVFKQMSKSE